MKILILQPRFEVYGGAELVIVRLCNYLSEKNIEHVLLTSNILSDVRRDLKKTEVIVPIESFDPFNDIRVYLKNNINNFTLFNLHNHPAEVLFYPYKRPSVWNCNEPSTMIMFGKEVPKEHIEAGQNISKIIVSDQYNQERIKKVYNKDSIIINYGIDIDFWSAKLDKEELRSKFHLENKFVLIHIGWFNEFKNQFHSLEAVHSLVKEIPNIKLLFVGFDNTSLGELCKKYVLDNSLENNVEFFGHINRNTLRQLLNCSDLGLFPYYEQGGWLSPFETLCAGVPIVVYPRTLSSRVIKENNLGIVSTSLKSTILDFYKDPIPYHSLTRNALNYIKKNMTWEQFCSRCLEVYKEVSE